MIDYISEVGVASSLFYEHVRAMSKFLVACFDIFKVFVAYSSVFKVLASFFPHLQGFVGIFLHLQSLGRDFLHLQSLGKDSCIFKVLIGTPCIFNVLLVFLKSWCQATVQCTLDVWAMLSLKNWCNFNASASANVECCRGFMNVGTALMQMKFWCGFINVGTALVWMKCWRSFMPSWMSAWLWCKWNVDVASCLHGCWHGFGANEMLT